MHIYFDLVHSSCPEQYDVYKDQTLVGYVRLRYGILSAYNLENRIYTYDFKSPFKGEFSSEEERKQYLDKISDILC